MNAIPVLTKNYFKSPDGEKTEAVNEEGGKGDAPDEGAEGKDSPEKKETSKGISLSPLCGFCRFNTPRRPAEYEAISCVLAVLNQSKCI